MLSLNGILPPDSSRPLPSSFLASNSVNELLGGSGYLLINHRRPHLVQMGYEFGWTPVLFPGCLDRCKNLRYDLDSSLASRRGQAMCGRASDFLPKSGPLLRICAAPALNSLYFHYLNHRDEITYISLGICT